MKSKKLREFIEENCIECKEKCNKGIVEMPDFIRCVDKMITKKKGKEENV